METETTGISETGHTRGEVSQVGNILGRLSPRLQPLESQPTSSSSALPRSNALSDMGLCPSCQVELELDYRGELITHGCCTCRDSGRVRTTMHRTDPDFGRSSLCPDCVGAQRGTVAAPSGEFEGDRSRVPMTLLNASLNTWLPNDGPPVVKVRQWVQRWPPERHVMLITGHPGRGKSHLAVAAMRAVWTQHGKRARFWLVPELLARLRATQDRDNARETLEAVHDEMARTSLLVLDDLGTEKATDWGYEQMFKVIDRRYREGLPIIVTTNLQAAAMDARLLSRLQDKQYSALVDIDSTRYPDHRRTG